MKNRFFKRAAAGIVSLSAVMGLIGTAPIVPADAAGAVTINEVCAKNTKNPAPDGQFYDWAEIYQLRLVRRHKRLRSLRQGERAVQV